MPGLKLRQVSTRGRIYENLTVHYLTGNEVALPNMQGTAIFGRAIEELIAGGSSEQLSNHDFVHRPQPRCRNPLSTLYNPTVPLL